MEQATPIVLLALFFGMPTALVAWLERVSRNRWGAEPSVIVPAADDGYRAGPTVIAGAAKRAPRVVKVAAWVSIALGQMFVPGLVAGFYGLLAVGIGLISIPGLYVAARCFWSGVLLMRRAKHAPTYCDRTAVLSAALNLLIVVLCLGAMVLEVSVNSGGDHETCFAIALPTLVYAAISLTHAWLLWRAAAVLKGEFEGERSGEAEAVGALAVAPVR